MATVDTAILVAFVGLMLLFVDQYIPVNIVPFASVSALAGLGLGLLSVFSAFDPVKTVILALILLGYIPVASRAAGEEGDVLVLQRQSETDPGAVRSETDRLFEWLNSDEARVREAAAHTVGNLAEAYPQDVEPAIPRLIELLDDSEADIQKAAALALGCLADTYPEKTGTATPELADLVYAEDPETRITAIGTLVMQIDPFITNRLEDELETIAATLTDSFEHVAGEEYPLLLAGLKDIAEEYPAFVTQTERQLRRLLDHPDEAIRHDACEILSMIQNTSSLDETTLERLRELQADPASDVQSAATTILETDT